MKRLGLRCLLLFLLLVVSSTAQIPTNGLVAYYPFNGNANDMSGHGNNGTVVGATLTKDRFGKINSAYSFNGVDNYIRVLNDATLEPTAEVTVSAWANVSDFSSRSHVLTKRYNTSTPPYNSYGLSASSGSPSYWEASIPQIAIKGSKTAIVAGQWYHLVLVYDGVNLSLYVNNQLEVSGAATGPLTYTTMDMLIGSAAQLSGQYMTGKLDDIRVYNRALFPPEIAQLYNEPSNTGIEETDYSNSIAVFPTIVTDKLNISITGNYTANLTSFEIRNSLGELVAKSAISNGNYSLEKSSLGPNGLYLISVFDQQKGLIKTSKILLE